MVEACNNERKIVFYGIFKGIFSKLLNMPILPRFPLQMKPDELARKVLFRPSTRTEEAW